MPCEPETTLFTAPPPPPGVICTPFNHNPLFAYKLIWPAPEGEVKEPPLICDVI